MEKIKNEQRKRRGGGCYEYPRERTYSLFTDKHLKSLHDELLEQEHNEYKQQGEYMYENDYETVDVDLHSRLVESAAYINEGMKSGLRPSQLEESEREAMRSIFGNCWYIF